MSTAPLPWAYLSAAPSTPAKEDASLTDATAIFRVTVLLSTVPSLTVKETNRVRVEGSSLVLAYVTLRSAAW